MKRREFFEKIGLGSATLVALPAASSVGVTARAEQESAHAHQSLNGPLANATVSFGQWRRTDAALDRFAAATANPRQENNHQLLPGEVTIRAGGAVNFAIAGFHNVLIYDDGIQPSQIDSTKIVPGSVPPGLIDDPNGRVYRGLDPRLQPQDRVEVVRFPNPGTFLAVCGVLPHFNDGMFGFIRVLP